MVSLHTERGYGMKRFSKILWGGVVLGLCVGMLPAQQLSEIIRGSALGVPADVFDCRRGRLPCNLSFRQYSAVDPSEINGPANPTDGIPRYGGPRQAYISDAQTTANFPNSSSNPLGGDPWYHVWDGITDPGTSDHAGWYGTQAQIIFPGEIGNNLSFNCLPVTGQVACFFALDEQNAFNDTVRADGSPLLHIGGLSPIPCPTLVDNGLTSLTYEWEQPTNNTSNDGAASGITSAELFVFPNPASAGSAIASQTFPSSSSASPTVAMNRAGPRSPKCEST